MRPAETVVLLGTNGNGKSTLMKCIMGMVRPSAGTIVAEIDGQIYGFANCVVHENTWETQPVCYLEDLFVMASARRRGIGKALIEWLRNAMRAEGWARLYWVTREDNRRARQLYDQFALADGFVRYVVRQK